MHASLFVTYLYSIACIKAAASFASGCNTKLQNKNAAAVTTSSYGTLAQNLRGNLGTSTASWSFAIISGELNPRGHRRLSNFAARADELRDKQAPHLRMHCKIFLFANLVSHAKLLGKAADYEVFTDTFDPSRGSFKRGHGHGHKNKSKAATFGERRFGPRPKDQSVFFMMKASDRS